MTLQALRRRLAYAQRFPPGAACHRCGWADVRALVGGSKPLICYACRRERLGKLRTEGHHVGGRGNPFGRVVRVDANIHRVLSARQLDRPADLREPLVAPERMAPWLAIYRGEPGGNQPERRPPGDVSRELERLRIVAILDEADVAELVDHDRGAANSHRQWAMRVYRLYRRDRRAA